MTKSVFILEKAQHTAGVVGRCRPPRRAPAPVDARMLTSKDVQAVTPKSGATGGATACRKDLQVGPPAAPRLQRAWIHRFDGFCSSAWPRRRWKTARAKDARHRADAKKRDEDGGVTNKSGMVRRRFIRPWRRVDGRDAARCTRGGGGRDQLNRQDGSSDRAQDHICAVCKNGPPQSRQAVGEEVDPALLSRRRHHLLINLENRSIPDDGPEVKLRGPGAEAHAAADDEPRHEPEQLASAKLGQGEAVDGCKEEDAMYRHLRFRGKATGAEVPRPFQSHP